MAQTKNAVAAAVSAVAVEAVMFNESEIETIEQLGRDYQVAEDAKAKAERTLGSCDVALFDIVKGLNYVQFMKVREYFVTGCRDKGCPTDDAAGQVWVRAINRITTSCNFVRPKAESKDAKRMSEKAAKQAAELAAIPDDEIANLRASLISKGDDKSLKQAVVLGKEIARREKPEIDARAAGIKALRDKLIERVKDLAKAGTADAEDKLIAALNALS